MAEKVDFGSSRKDRNRSFGNPEKTEYRAVLEILPSNLAALLQADIGSNRNLGILVSSW